MQSGVKCPLLPLTRFPPEHVATICLPLQDLFTCVENTIAHQRCLVAKKTSRRQRESEGRIQN